MRRVRARGVVRSGARAAQPPAPTGTPGAGLTLSPARGRAGRGSAAPTAATGARRSGPRWSRRRPWPGPHSRPPSARPAEPGAGSQRRGGAEGAGAEEGRRPLTWARPAPAPPPAPPPAPRPRPPSRPPPHGVTLLSRLPGLDLRHEPLFYRPAPRTPKTPIFPTDPADPSVVGSAPHNPQPPRPRLIAPPPRPLLLFGTTPRLKVYSSFGRPPSSRPCPCPSSSLPRPSHISRPPGSRARPLGYQAGSLLAPPLQTPILQALDPAVPSSQLLSGGPEYLP
ncbi:uncharacterized protein [Equus caballus]|uniref:uncharacterized protein n=1 Tax=Equus caballus TaxID=9796 RepID=UPI0038B2EF6D